MYTLSVCVEEYVSFLWKLFWRVAKGDPSAGCVWKRDVEIVFRSFDEDDDPEPVASKPKKGSPKSSKRRKGGGDLPFQSRLLQSTASSRAFVRKKDLISSASASPPPSSTLDAYRAPQRKGALPAKQPEQRASADGGSLAAALTRRSSNAGLSAKHSDEFMRSSMRRKSLALDAEQLATVVGNRARRGSTTMIAETITETCRDVTETVTAAVRSTMRAIQPRSRRVTPQVSLNMKKAAKYCEARPLPVVSPVLEG